MISKNMFVMTPIKRSQVAIIGMVSSFLSGASQYDFLGKLIRLTGLFRKITGIARMSADKKIIIPQPKKKFTSFDIQPLGLPPAPKWLATASGSSEE